MAEKKITSKNELIYGAHAIIEVLKAKKRKIISIYTTKPFPKSWDRIQSYLSDKNINIQYVARSILDRMAGTTDHNNILAWVTPFKYITKPFDPQKKSLIIMLDAVQDVRNLGAILRSAYCTGVQGVVICKTQSALLTGAAFKASAGLAEHLDIYLAPSMHHAVMEHKRLGYHCYMAALGGKNALDVEYQSPACIIIGNEASGISKNILAMGEKIMLPQKTPDISYNASVAAGILLFLVSTKLRIV